MKQYVGTMYSEAPIRGSVINSYFVDDLSVYEHRVDEAKPFVSVVIDINGFIVRIFDTETEEDLC